MHLLDHLLERPRQRPLDPEPQLAADGAEHLHVGAGQRGHGAAEAQVRGYAEEDGAERRRVAQAQARRGLWEGRGKEEDKLPGANKMQQKDN